MDVLVGMGENSYDCIRSNIDRERCTFCLSNMIPWVYNKKAYEAANQCFENSEVMSRLPQNLKDKVFADWFHNHDAPERREVQNHFLYLLGIVSMICIYLGMEAIKFVRQQRALSFIPEQKREVKISHVEERRIFNQMPITTKKN